MLIVSFVDIYFKPSQLIQMIVYSEEWERNSGFTIRESAKNEERERQRRMGIDVSISRVKAYLSYT